MNVNHEYPKKAAVWSALFLFHYVITYFVLKPLGITYDSGNSWIAGTFSLAYIAIIAFFVQKFQLIPLEKREVGKLFLLSVMFAFASIIFVTIYRYIYYDFMALRPDIVSTPFLWYTYIFPRSAGIIYQQLMVYYLVMLTANYFTTVKEQSKVLMVVFGVTHLPVFIIVSPFMSAFSMLVGSFIFGYLLPKIYAFFSPKGLFIGYILHYSFYMVFAPVMYFLYRWAFAIFINFARTIH